jgi:hypothetical protein
MRLRPPVANNIRDRENATGVSVIPNTCKEPFTERMERAGMRVRRNAQAAGAHTCSG